MWFTKEKICLTSPVFYWKIFLNLIDESHFILIKYLIGSFSFWCYSHILLRRAKWHLPKKYPFFFLNFESCLLWLLAIILTSKNKQQFSICDRRGSKGGGCHDSPHPKKKTVLPSAKTRSRLQSFNTASMETLKFLRDKSEWCPRES